MVDLGLKDRVVIVTGTSQGIGSALAMGFASQGSRVVLASRNRELNEALAAKVEDAGSEAFVVSLDVTSTTSVQAMVEAVMEKYGRIDSLVNNAGWTSTGPLLEETADNWDRTLDTSLKGVFLCSQRVGRVMATQHSGTIVNIGSTLGQVVFHNRGIYAAAKGGLEQLTKAFALELSQYGVRCNAVGPCFTETPTRRNLLENKEFTDWALSMLPLGRWAQPDDIVLPVLMLASEAIPLMTGQVILVDGGWTLQ